MQNIQTQKYCKKNIPQAVRRAVWNHYLSEDIGKADCYVGCKTKITQLNFECGHVEAERNGGKTTIDNLRPICSNCNRSMGTTNMHEFMKTFGFKTEENIQNDILLTLQVSNMNEKQLIKCNTLTYFINNCIENKQNNKISLNDMYELFIGVCSIFCEDYEVESINKKKFISYYLDNNYIIKDNYLINYKFKYEEENKDDDEDDENDEFYDVDN